MKTKIVASVYEALDPHDSLSELAAHETIHTTVELTARDLLPLALALPPSEEAGRLIGVLVRMRAK